METLNKTNRLEISQMTTPKLRSGPDNKSNDDVKKDWRYSISELHYIDRQLRCF